jgi:hypothetical protein
MGCTAICLSTFIIVLELFSWQAAAGHRLLAPNVARWAVCSLYLSSEVSDRLWGPRSLILNGYRRSSPGLKRPGFEVNYLPPSATEVKNKTNYTV